MKKQLLFQTIILIIILASCKKDEAENQKTDSRVTHYVYSNYSSKYYHTDNYYTYSNDKLTTSVTNDEYKEVISYFNDSVIIRTSVYEDAKWVKYYKTVYLMENGLISRINDYNYTDSTDLESWSILTYENDNLTDFSNYNKIGKLASRSSYIYNQHNLAEASYYYRKTMNQELKESVKRAFSYIDDLLYEEKIYFDSYSGPIELKYSKNYFYEDGFLTSREVSKYENGISSPYSVDTFIYDDNDNILRSYGFSTDGLLTFERDYEYEPGRFSYQSIFDVESGSYYAYPVSGVNRPGRKLKVKPVNEHEFPY